VTVPPDVETTVEIRPAERADLLSVLRIERASFSQPWPYDAFDQFLGKSGFLVATEQGSSSDDIIDAPVVGYVVADVIHSHGRPIGHVKDLAVHPDRRGAGIGSALLERALSVLGGTRSVKLEVRESNDGARSLYEQFEFEAFRRMDGYYNDGEDAIVMIREME
jgi:ribosomal-protein-alanine N-acetyltransferase